MKKKLILFILLLLTTSNVYATGTYPKTFKTENYGVVLNDSLKCGNTIVEYLGYSNDGNVFVKDSNEKIYIWDDNKCTVAEPQKILDMYNQLETTREDVGFGNIKVTTKIAESAYQEGYVENTEPFNDQLTYWYPNATNGWQNGTAIRQLNEDNFYEDTYYLLHTFFHVKTTEYDPSKTYYKIIDNGHYIFEKITEPFTEEESINIYYMDDNSDFNETTKTIKYEYYNELAEEYDSETTYSIYINGKIIENVLYDDESGTHVKHFDEEKNEVHPEYDEYVFYEVTSKFILALKYDYSKMIILDYDFNLIDEPGGYPNGCADAGDLLIYSNINLDTYEPNYYYYKAYYVMDGQDQTYNKGNLTIRFSGNLDIFDKIYIDDKLVNNDNYTKKSGSTIIEFKESYLNTLTKGKHTVKAVYTNGAEVSTTFTKTNNLDNPDTSDNIILNVVLGSISLISLVSIGLYTNRKKIKA